MTARRLLLAAAAALALSACDDSAPDIGLGLRAPSAVAAFRGVTPERPDRVAPYVAVANAAGAELILLDPEDNRPVVSPGLVFALSVPTGPRPEHLATASLSDGDALADALVVAGPPDVTGQAVLQLVSTWDAAPRVVEEVPLGVPGPIRAILGTPVPDGAGAPVPGRARVVVATPNGTLTVVALSRGAGGAVTVTGVATTTALGFDVVDLAPAPDLRLLYAASEEPIPSGAGAVEGVAELGAAGDDPAAWTVRALDAGAPTRAVAAVNVRERNVVLDGDGRRPPVDELLPAVPRVYAALDPSRCGAERTSGCGIVTIDPATGGLAADPLGELPSRAPIRIPGVLLDLVATSVRPAQRPPSGNDEFGGSQGIRLVAGTGARATDAVLLASSSDGNAYVIDLSRYGPPMQSSPVRTDSRVRATSASTTVDLRYLPATEASNPDPDVVPFLGLWYRAPLSNAAPALVTGGDRLALAVGVTLGFTDDDVWRVAWQGALPGLEEREAVLSVETRGVQGVVVAFQRSLGDLQERGPSQAWTRITPVYDPRVGVRVGDVVELRPDVVCQTPSDPLPDPPILDRYVDARVVAILPPDPPDPLLSDRWPGGALLLEADPAETRWTACLAQLEPGRRYPGAALVRSQAYVLSSSSRGHVGRPVLGAGPGQDGTFPDLPTAVAYPIAGSGAPTEAELLAACPLANWRIGDPPAACDEACRRGCEALYAARGARRFYYPAAEACLGPEDCDVPGLTDPLRAGPVVSFRLGKTAGNGESVDDPPRDPPRGAALSFSVQSGWRPMARGPSGAGLPDGFALVDRSVFADGAETGLVFYSPYDGDVLFGVAPSAVITLSAILR